jgi:hypothetical protein
MNKSETSTSLKDIEELKRVCKENEVPKIIIDNVEYYILLRDSNKNNTNAFIISPTNE